MGVLVVVVDGVAVVVVGVVVVVVGAVVVVVVGVVVGGCVGGCVVSTGPAVSPSIRQLEVSVLVGQSQAFTSVFHSRPLGQWDKISSPLLQIQ